MGRFNYQTPERLNQFHSVPVGTILPFAGASIPAGWIECAGQAVSRTTYPDLFGSIGTTYGAGDGSTTFNLPDLRGEFLRGWDNGRGVDPGRAHGSAQGGAVESHSHDINAAAGAYSDVLAFMNQTGGAGQSVSGRRTYATGGTETRPRNVAVRFCIRAFGSVENSGLIDVGALAVEVAGKAALSAFTGANQSLSASGYQKLPSGLIIQWGSWTSSGTAGNAIAVSFPIAFPNGAMGIGLAANVNSTSTQSAWFSDLTASGFNGRANSTSNNMRYVAIGY